MDINFKGSLGKINKAELKRYLGYSAYNLLPENVANELKLNVIYGTKSCFDAYVEVCDSDIGKVDPRSFNIHIDDVVDELASLLTTVCHEMVHVKQFAMNEVTEGDTPGRIIWKGEEVFTSGSKADYFNSPWEIEAYGKENGLYYGAKEHFEMVDMLLSV